MLQNVDVIVTNSILHCLATCKGRAAGPLLLFLLNQPSQGPSM